MDESVIKIYETNINIKNDYKEKLSNFAGDYLNKNQSSISNLFFELFQITFKCVKCKKKDYQFQIYFGVHIYIHEVRKYKENLEGDVVNKIDIYDHFKYKKNYVISHKQKCIFCKRNTHIEENRCYCTLPLILMIDLNWEKEKSDELKFIINEKIKLDKYVTYQNKQFYEKYEFELFSLFLVKTFKINNYKNKIEYIPVFKDTESNKYILGTDKQNEKIKYSISQIADIGTPIILFYRKIDL